MSARDLTRLITSVTGDVVITQKIFSKMSLYLESKNLSTINNTVAVGNKEAQIQEVTSIGLGGISEKSGVSLIHQNAAEITCGVEKTAKAGIELSGIGKTETAIDSKCVKQAGEKLGGATSESIYTYAVNQTSEAILKNGYYEVNGFKFSEYYYERLWNEGRKAPSLIAKEILEGTTKITSDKRPGFFRYELGNWEIVYNPVTKEVWHLGPIKITK